MTKPEERFLSLAVRTEIELQPINGVQKGFIDRTSFQGGSCNRNIAGQIREILQIAGKVLQEKKPRASVRKRLFMADLF